MVFCNDTIIKQNGFCPAARRPAIRAKLYEAALEGSVLFAIINIATLAFRFRLRRPGMNAGLFLVCYGVFSALLENRARTGHAHARSAARRGDVGMLLSVPMILGGAWLINRSLKQPKWRAA